MTLRYLGRIDPSVRDHFPQQIGFTSPRDMYLSQASKDADGEDAAVTHFRDRVPVSTMRGFRCHGYPMFVREVDGIPLVKMWHNGTVNSWVEVPYVPDYTWTDKALAGYKAKSPPFYKPKQPYWSQGRVHYRGHLYELLGGPWTKNGAREDADYGPTRLMIYDGSGALVSSVDAQWCGRVGGKSSGLPERGRVEPEGLALTQIGGRDVLVLNFATGWSWGKNLNIACHQYTYDLNAADAVKVRR